MNKGPNRLLDSEQKLMERFPEPVTEGVSPANFGSASKKKESKDVDRLEIENFVTSRHETDLVDIASGHEFTLSKKEEFFNENNCSAASKRSNNETVTNLE